MCKATGLRIVNGRYGHDKDKGSITYTNVGSSVIDYLLMKECDFLLLDDFSVNDFTMFSDHAPLTIKLNCSLNLSQDRDKTEYTYCKWDSARKDEFRRQLISQLPFFNNSTQTADNLTAENIDHT
ncbi:MAG: hypothetical protein AB2693_15855, partial [Candidatus Thiodiazotropha sp.]